MKKLLMVALLVIAALAVGYVGDASATCSAAGKILYVYSTGSTTYVYIGSGSQIISYTTYFVTNNNLLSNAATAAFAGGYWVNIAGNATTCPTTGTVRLGGSMTTIAAYRNY